MEIEQAIRELISGALEPEANARFEQSNEPPQQPKPAPTPLPEAPSRAVMPLDADMLPDEMWNYIADTADRQQSPPDFVAAAALVALSGVVGRKVLIQPKQRDTAWLVAPNLWGALIGAPSSMKSPTLKDALRPLDDLERDARLEFEAQKQGFSIESEMNKVLASQFKDKAKKAGADHQTMRQYLEQAAALESEQDAPTSRRLIVNDATVEKLGELLNQNPNGLTMVRDELAGWLAKMNASDAGQDRAFYLEAFNGTGSYTFDRIGRGTQRIESACIALVGGIQPSKLAPLVRGAISGQSDDGLLQRLQIAVWPELSSSWRMTDRAPCLRSHERYAALFKRLDAMPRFAPSESVPIIKFDNAAYGLFKEWSTDLNIEVRNHTLSEAMQSHLLKLQQTVVRVAGLFALTGGREDVSEMDMLQATTYSDYLRTHANKIYGLAHDAGLDGARLLLERRDKIPSPFTVRDVYRKEWTGLSTQSDAQEACDILVEHGWLLAQETSTTGRPTTTFTWTEARHE